MDSGHLRRRTVALIAAYAVALHGLLLAFVPAAPAALGPLAVLCAHDSAGDPGQGQPSPHDLPCAALCAALSHGVAGPVPPSIGLPVAAAENVAAAVPASDWVLPRRVLSGPQIPRGPPLA